MRAGLFFALVAERPEHHDHDHDDHDRDRNERGGGVRALPIRRLGSIDATTVTLRSNGTPDHASPYWGSGSALYESPQAGMQVNPTVIASQNFVLRVPLSPAVGTASDTPLGPMGIAVNGVAIFNQYAAGRSPLTSELLSFDRFNGHPQNTGVYHYHVEPLWLTSNHGAASLIGVLLDGFPIYGPRETDGSAPSGLDSCNGHTHPTADVAAGIYPYHVTATSPYIAGCYRGTPGTIDRADANDHLERARARQPVRIDRRPGSRARAVLCQRPDAEPGVLRRQSESGTPRNLVAERHAAELGALR